METEESDQQLQLLDNVLNCIEDLRHDNRSELSSICEFMYEKYGVSSEQTKLLLDRLKLSAKVFTVEQKGVIVYMTIQPSKPRKPRTSFNGEVKETSSLLSACVKALNQVAYISVCM